MDRKSSKGSNLRADRQKKRRFRGNQFTVKKETSFTSVSAAKLRRTGDEEGAEGEMNSQEHKGTAEVTVKEENVEDGDTAVVYPEYDINRHGLDIKQECGRDISADSRYVGDNLIDLKEDTAPVFSDFAIDIQETDMKKGFALVSNTETLDVYGRDAISSSSDMNDQLSAEKHSGNNPRGCEHCGKTFSQKAHFTSHEWIYSEENCGYCGKKSIEKDNLISHESMHSGEKPYSCEDCGKTFSKKCLLISHGWIHSGEKAYSCRNCPQTFSRKDNLKSHERIHTGEKPYSCGQCEKVFTRKSYLESHERIHSGEKPYCCGQCGKIFSEKNHLKSHERIHSGEKPYNCRICSKKFTRKDNLNSHVRIHSGEKPYSCGYCARTFTKKISLKSHERIHNVENP